MRGKVKLILGIETSCDDTGVGLVSEGARGRLKPVLNLVRSQETVHAKHGGIVPELASRRHLEDLGEMLDESLNPKKGTGSESSRCLSPFPPRGLPLLTGLTGIGVTRGPGLVGSLLVGLSAAKALSYSLGIPLVGVNHLEAHLLTPFLMEKPPKYPYVALIASGGHTELILAREFGDYQRLGRTRDDAAGEAFDKVGRLMGLGYPAGQAIDNLSKKGKSDGLRLPVAQTGPFEFSFSGLKTAARLMLADLPRTRHADFAAALQQAIVRPLADKSVAAALEHNARALVIAGGVARNLRLRELLKAAAPELKKAKCDLLIPPVEWCTDNGLMVAAAAALYLRAGRPSSSEVDVNPSLDL